jgi:hypothetical protein
MDNIQIEVKDNKAVITIDLSKDFGPSKSGKTIVVATTRGNVPIPGAETIRLGLNCYKYPEENKYKIITVLNLLSGILIKRGYEAETATSGSQGIEVF